MKLKDMTARRVVTDEVDPYPYDPSAQGDLVALAKARVATFAPHLRDGALELVMRRKPFSPAAVRIALSARKVV